MANTTPGKGGSLSTIHGLPGKEIVRRASGIGRTLVKLSTKGRYAVMAMVDLAKHSADRPVTLADIASRQEISLSYLEQLFAKLRNGGLVRATRGPGGGYRLARSADETRVADIIFAVDEPIKATRCEIGSPKGCTGTTARCATHDLWEELGRQIHIFLSAVSLADILDKRVLGMSGHPHQTRMPETPPPSPYEVANAR